MFCIWKLFHSQERERKTVVLSPILGIIARILYNVWNTGTTDKETMLRYTCLCYCIFFALEIQKVLIKLSKEHGCEIVGKWRKACVRHYYWSVTSTAIKMGEVIIAKFHSFLYHILNKHKDLPNPLFKECAHRENIRPKVWFTKSKL